MTCEGCGRDLSEDALFCSRCGARKPVSAEDPTEPGRAQAGLPLMRFVDGTRVGRFTVKGVLGEGGMGVVYRAEDETGREVALKCLHSNLAGDPEIRRRFAREARVLGGWIHPSIVTVHELLEHEYLLAFAMDLVSGPTLREHVERWRGRMPYEEIGRIFGAILEAMEEGHRRGLVHRDLKPDNVLVTLQHGRLVPKIVDFGIAKILEGTTYTMTGAMLGTCAYMSPEQIRRPHLVDARSDIYALGVTLYQMVTGALPFEAADQFALAVAHVMDQPKPASAHRADVTPALDRLLLDMLAKSPADRPRSCAEVAARLLQVLEGTEDTMGEKPTHSEPPGELLASMVLVPEGPFAMGKGRRNVHLEAFYIDRIPVTNRAYAAFVDATGYRPSDANARRFLSHFRDGKPSPKELEHPVTFVSWVDARAYAAWVGKRLPTEAEWEKAARGVDGRKYPWGRAAPSKERANFRGVCASTTAVGAFAAGASPYGALDMAGNVWEWCEDSDDPAFYENGPAHNPRNLSRSERRPVVMRGGSFMYGAGSLTTTSRTSFDHDYRFADGGFRCARSATW